MVKEFKRKDGIGATKVNGKAIIDNLNNERVATFKEFDLSKKIKCVEAGAVSELPLGTDYDYEMIFTKDFKEFIRLLKERIIDMNFEERECCSAMKIGEGFNLCGKCINKEIDKLAGKELSK